MPSLSCVAHPGAAATFRCDGCGRLLCFECVEQGHAATLDAIYLP